MPIYEFRCRKCGKKFSVLTLRASEKVRPVCTKCGATAADRLMSRFAMPKSDEARAERLADPANFGDLDADDPRSMARWMRRMGKEMGEDLGGEDADEIADEIESGGDGDAADD